MNEHTASLPSVVRRITASHMLLDGAIHEEVASRLGLSMPTVRRYQSLINEGGLAALEKLSVGGRKSILDQATRDLISSALRGSPVAHGFDSHCWKTALRGRFIAQKVGARFSRVYV